MNEKKWTDDERDEAFDRGMETMQRVALELYRRGREPLLEELEEARARNADMRAMLEQVTRERDEARDREAEWAQNSIEWQRNCEEARAELAALRKRVVEALPYPTDDDSDESRTAEEAIEIAVAERDSAYRSRDLAIKMWDEARAEVEHAYREGGALYEAKIALAEAEAERDEARREADRFRHGCTVEGDFVCPNEYAVSELTAERNFLRALKKNHEEDFARVCKERDEARANYQWMVDRACDEKLEGYRELAAKCAQLEEERDKARAEAASSLAMARIADEKHGWKCAEVDMLRGVGCMEDGDGPCGACRKCFYRHGYRRGAEAMREACARWMSEREGIAQWVYDDALGALPIPGEP